MHVWRLLVGHFVLPPECQQHHVCDWVVLDTGLAGCRVCGSVHSCADNACRRFVTEDSEVCDITGLCVRACNFVETCFSDNVIVDCKAEDYTAADRVRDCMGNVREVVQEALVYRVARECHAAEHRRAAAKVTAIASNYASHELRPSNNICDAVEHVALHVCRALPAALHAFDLPLRQRVASRCATNIERALSVCVTTFNMQMREQEVEWFALGLLFLMRRGVFVGQTCALPREPDLLHLLSSENLLCRTMNISTKCITDSENRFKFNFRMCSEDSLRVLENLFIQNK